MDLELELFGDLKDKSSTSENKPGENKPLNASAAVAIGKVFMLSLSSQPVDHEDVSGRTKVIADVAISTLNVQTTECSCSRALTGGRAKRLTMRGVCLPYSKASYTIDRL